VSGELLQQFGRSMRAQVFSGTERSDPSHQALSIEFEAPKDVPMYSFSCRLPSGGEAVYFDFIPFAGRLEWSDGVVYLHGYP